MAKLIEFLSELRRLDVRVWADGDQLRISAPDGVLTPALRKTLKERKGEILDFLSSAEETQAIPAIPPAARDRDLPLSYAQQQMWFLAQLNPGNHAYNMPAVVRLTGMLDHMALEKSINGIVERHEALRTTFVMSDSGQPFQVVAASLTVPMPVLDLRDVAKGDRQARAKDLIAKETQTPFDLSKGPLTRALLVCLDEAEHILVLTLHHIVSDGWAMGLLVHELTTFYRAFATGQAPALAPLSVQYADFAVWQRQRFAAGELGKQMDYWRAQLDGTGEAATLPADRTRGSGQNLKGGCQTFLLPSALLSRLKAFSQEEGVTLFAVLLAAFDILLYRYSGLEDISVGTFSANRNQAQIEALIGVFINTLVLRSQVKGIFVFRDFLKQVYDTSTQAHAHQDLPFDKLAEVLQAGHGRQKALFRTMLVLQNAPLPRIELPGLGMEWIRLERSEAFPNSDLDLFFEETADGLLGIAEYNSDLFDAATLTRMAGHLQVLLEAIVAHPDYCISDLSILTDDEKRWLATWNATQAAYPEGKCLHELFEAQVKRTPDAVAIVFGEQQLTYRELNQRANQLARHLQKQGVGPGVLVGICVERSLEMMVGLFGILKAGGAYVPLDPNYPRERLAFMLANANLRILLTQECLRERLSDGAARLLCLDTDWPSVEAESGKNLGQKITPQDLLYVIYTSGSTGQPKGSGVYHRGFVNLLNWFVQDFKLTSADSVLLISSLSFDLTQKNLYAPLIVGGTLHLFASEHYDAAEIVRVVCAQGISWLNCTPSAFYPLVDCAGDSLRMKESLRYVFLGGEPISLPRLSGWLGAGNGQTQLVNTYGPTECTDISTAYRLSRTTPEGAAGIPIGKPIFNVQAYVLDVDLQPAPVGVVGELYIGGAGVGLGYINNFDLTLEKFVPDRWGAESGARLYRTGDLARRLPDGNLEFLGRGDQQVKLRGFRIELGEIEAALARHPAVRESAVVVRDERLVAYVVAQDGQELITADLRQCLRDQLPEYMIPALFVMLGALPLTPNGKVDRKALPAPDGDRPALAADFVAPRTAVEQTLASLWAEVLGLEHVGVHDNFFELGGDSILSIQVIARAHQAGLKFTPRQLFQYRTIAELAEVADMAPVIRAEQGVVSGPVPLGAVQRWFFEKDLSEPQHWNQAVLLNVLVPLNPDWLAAAWRRLLIQHDALRARFERTDSGWQQVYSEPGEEVPFQRVDLGGVETSEQPAAIEAQIARLQASLDLQNGPLLRAVYFDLGPGREARLFVAIHHLAVDGVSWRILLEDLLGAYYQLSQGQEIVLPAKTTSFREWVARLSSYARESELRKELDYWLALPWDRLSPLPVDKIQSVGENLQASTATVALSLSAAETQSLLQNVPEAYHTQINDALLASLGLALARWSGNQAVLLDLEGHGREDLFEDVDLSRTVGWFTSIFPVLLEIGDANAPGETLKAVKEALRAVPGRGLGYGLLRYLCQDVEMACALQNLPAAQVVFNYFGQLDQALGDGTVFAPATESVEPLRSPRGKRPYLLEIHGSVIQGCLQIIWHYSTDVHERATIEKVAGWLMDELRSLIAHCAAPGNRGYTPSDFPKLKLAQPELDRLVAQASCLIEGFDASNVIEDIYPLSPMQQGMLFHSLSAPESGVYFQQLTCTFGEYLDVAALEQAWGRVVARHTILRSAFHWERDGDPFQIVYRHVHLPILHLDWRDLSPEAQARQLQATWQAERQRGFVLSQPPLMRLTLIRLSESVYHFVWGFHHLLLDGWSWPLLMQEVFAFYEAFSRQRELQLDPPRPFGDYIAWLQRQDMSLAEAFWRETLKGFTAPTPLTVGRSSSGLWRDVESEYTGQAIRLSEAMTTALQDLARRQQLTLSTLVQGAWALLLSRYSGENDVLFGVTVSGRPPELRGAEEMMGIFINTLPVRVRIPWRGQLLAWLKELQAGQVEMRQYEYSPLVQIQEWSDVPRGQPLFESLLLFENYPGDSAVQAAGRGMAITDVRIVEQTNYPLTVIASPGAELSLRLNYARRRFDDQTMLRMLEHLRILLEGLAANPEGQLIDLPLLTAAEREQVLSTWNMTQARYPQERCIHELFEAQAERTPDAVALVFEDRPLTYRELDSRANQLARHLQKQGVAAETLVGICVERSLEMVVGLLGILKAGGAYVPLDPSYPRERLAFMLDDSGLEVLLTHERLAAALPAHTARVVYLDSDWPQIAREETMPAPRHSDPAQLAYVIYTSGSTGRPKGVQVCHNTVVNFLASMGRAPGLTASDRLLSVTTLSFDIAGLELYLPLTVGAQVHIAPREVTLDGQLLREHLATSGATVMQATPATWRLLLEAGWEAREKLKILCGGEALPPALADALLERAHSLWNLYGPTETTIWSTLSQVESHQPLTIGRPIANTQVYILDAYLNPVPPEVPGELYIGGAGLARGYLGRPELTAERFIPDPFGAASGARLYRTGDLARWLPDGTIECLGRIDQQVKLRGFRIELGEIETTLSRYPSVLETAVVVRDERLVAYVVAQAGQTLTANLLRDFLKSSLPEYMLPALFVFLPALPLTPNGKLDRKALPAPEPLAGTATGYIAPRNELEQVISQVWSDVLQVQKVGVDDNFFDLGGHSLLLGRIRFRLNERLQRNVSMVELFQYPTVGALARHLSLSQDETPASLSGVSRAQHRRDLLQQPEEAIAVIGLAGRYPGARDVDEFWQNLCAGKESISFFTDAELQAAGVEAESLGNPRYVKAGTLLEHVEEFDTFFFGYNPREAALIDPQQRVFLETAWEALERAGYDSERYPGRVGVFASVSANTYLLNHLASNPGLLKTAGAYQAMLANDKDFLTTRVSYKLNLKGPSLNVQTACSSSLVAVHLACQSLLSGESDMALAGGVSIRFPQQAGYLYEEGGIASPDGHCRAFDANSKGTVGGNGAGVVVLKRLSQALADGDVLYAVIKGTAINNDGSLKVGYTAPSVEGQAEVVSEAQSLAGVPPETVGYIETHGTGTELGDPIEIAALTQAFRNQTDRNGFCAIGSVKTNIGHLDAAAGITGLIKAVMALRHAVIPPSLHFERPNPRIDFEHSPFFVNTTLAEWQPGALPRRAGVSSFGIGGTNAHAVLEEPPLVEPSGPSRPWQLLLLSARTETALAKATSNLAEHFKAQPAQNLADAAFTLQIGRQVFNHRRAVVCRNLDEAVQRLEAPDARQVWSAVQEQKNQGVAFMFTGQGSQYVGMGRELYLCEPLFREQVDQCAELLQAHLGLDLRTILYPDETSREAAALQLEQTWLAQPALFVVEYALARLWMSWGVKPQAMIGHSIGEYVAACLAGVFSLEDALALVAARGRLMQSLPAGAMLAVPWPEPQVKNLLDDELCLAAVNGPALCVVSGPVERIAALEERLKTQEVETRRLHASHAFHSAMMDPILQAFDAEVRRFQLNPPQIACVSNLTGEWLTAGEATDPAYWVRHLRETVRFGAGLAQLFGGSTPVLLEVGPGRTLSSLASGHPARAAEQVILSSLRHPQDPQSDEAFLLATLGRLWLAGVKVDWQAFSGGERRQRVPLPTYPFERQRCWLEFASVDAFSHHSGRISRKENVADWFYTPSWVSRPWQAKPATLPENCLIFTDSGGLGLALARQLQQKGVKVTTALAGTAWAEADAQYVLDPACADDYQCLLRELATRGRAPDLVVHLWSLTRPGESLSGPEHFARAQVLGFSSLILMTQALKQQTGHKPVHFEVISNGVYPLEQAIQPEKTSLLGPCRVIPQELLHVTCRYLDVVLPPAGTRQETRLLGQWVADILEKPSNGTFALRDGQRWEQRFDPLPLAEPASEASPLREKGVYLITGGLGNIGLVVAGYLARQVQARVALVARSKFPARSEWDALLSGPDAQGELARKICRIREMEAIGAEVIVLEADVADLQAMQEVVAHIDERWGALNGVFHLAGVMGNFKSAQEIAALDYETDFRPKVHGLYVLEQILQGREPDFCVLFSSLASVLGGLGYVGYSAANNFMDAGARWQAQRGSTRWVSVNWDSWQTDEMLSGENGSGATLNELAIAPDEGIEALRRILSTEQIESQVIVSTGDLQARVDQWIKLDNRQPASVVAQPRPALSTAFLAPRSVTEQTLAAIWQELLGIEQIGVHDSFFDLGGHSLLATQVISRLREAFETDVPIRKLFEMQTIAELADYIDHVEVRPGASSSILPLGDEDLEETRL